MNSKPGIKFVDTSGHFLQATLASASGVEIFGLVAVKVQAGADNGHIISVANPSVDNKFAAVKEEALEAHFTVSNTTERSINDTVNTSDKIIRFETTSATSYKVATNGAAYTTGTTSYGSGIGSGDNFNTVFIGKSKTSDAIGSGRMFNGTFHEAFLFVEGQTASVYNCIESNMGTEFNVSGAIKEDGTVRTWYDQSGNNNHVTQTTVANQPSLVSSGVLLTAGVTFDQSRATELEASGAVITASATGAFSTFSVQTVDNSESGYLFGNASTSNGASLYAQGSNYLLSNKNAGSNLNTIAKTSSQNLLSMCYNNTATNFKVNGGGTEVSGSSTHGFAAGTGQFYLGNRNGGTSDGTRLNGSIKEIIVYNSDQSDNRTAFESNIAEHYNIALPAGFDSKNNTVSGFVTTWYDQSGNGNHLVQSTANDQPKVVDSGSLVVNSDGFGGIALGRFGSSINGQLDFTSGITISNSHSFQYLEFQRNFAHTLISSTGGGSNRIGRLSGNNLQIKRGGTHNFASGITVGSNPFLYTTFLAADGSASKVHINGVERQNTTYPNETGNSTFVAIGRGDNDNANPFLITELILYSSEQSNRTAIEANMTSHYNIT